MILVRHSRPYRRLDKILRVLKLKFLGWLPFVFSENFILTIRKAKFFIAFSATCIKVSAILITKRASKSTLRPLIWFRWKSVKSSSESRMPKPSWNCVPLLYLLWFCFFYQVFEVNSPLSSHDFSNEHPWNMFYLLFLRFLFTHSSQVWLSIEVLNVFMQQAVEID